MELIRPGITRWTARLADRDQERRFNEYNLLSQRRTILAIFTVLLIANGLTFAVSALLLLRDGAAVPLGRAALHAVTLLAGGAIALGLARERRHVWLRTLTGAGVILLSSVMCLLIGTGAGMGLRGAIAVIAGVAVIYLSVPLSLPAVTGFAALFTAAALPLWWASVGADAGMDRVYVAMCVAMAHVVGYVQARRTHQERRVLFAQRETLLALSSVDPLTGLMNRRAVDAEMARAWRYWQRSGTPLAVVMVDIDHFKRLNDTQGHIAGDHALRLVADVIRGAMPLIPGQVAARYGGEEFICLLPGLDSAEATLVAGKILAGVRRIGIPLVAPADGSAGAATILTVSAGVASADARIARPEELVHAADRQLYRAKDEGRNCVRAESGVLMS